MLLFLSPLETVLCLVVFAVGVYEITDSLFKSLSFISLLFFDSSMSFEYIGLIFDIRRVN